MTTLESIKHKLTEEEYKNLKIKYEEDRQYRFYYKDEVYINEEEMLARLLREDILFANSREYFCPCSKTKKEETIVLFVNLNDVFWWATADAESIALDELPELFSEWEKNNKWGHVIWGCKKRNLQPQIPMKKKMIEDGAWRDDLESLPKPHPS